MNVKEEAIYALILLLVFVPERYALWCPEGCNCDNENLFVNCGNEGKINIQYLTILILLYISC